MEYVVCAIFLCHFVSCGKQLKITKLPTRENFESTKKKFGYEIPTRKNFGPTKYPQEKILDPRNTEEGITARWH